MDILRRFTAVLVYVVRQTLSHLLGYKQCPECGKHNLFGALYCANCGNSLVLSKAEGVFAVATNPERAGLLLRAYRLGGRSLVAELFNDLCQPL